MTGFKWFPFIRFKWLKTCPYHPDCASMYPDITSISRCVWEQDLRRGKVTGYTWFFGKIWREERIVELYYAYIISYMFLVMRPSYKPELLCSPATRTRRSYCCIYFNMCIPVRLRYLLCLYFFSAITAPFSLVCMLLNLNFNCYQELLSCHPLNRLEKLNSLTELTLVGTKVLF